MEPLVMMKNLLSDFSTLKRKPTFVEPTDWSIYSCLLIRLTDLMASSAFLQSLSPEPSAPYSSFISTIRAVEPGTGVPISRSGSMLKGGNVQGSYLTVAYCCLPSSIMSAAMS